ncbi:hypothetical protein ACWERI_35540 [Streptomyces collinus]
MIRLPSSHAAITAPLVASSTTFPGIPIGRSLLDGRPFHLSPVQAPAAILPSTNSLALGGLGSGKSTTAKARIRREILDHAHQAVVIDSFGEDSAGGEWAPLVRSLGGRVIEAGAFTLNPVSTLLPPEVREQLVRSLIAAVEPGALSHQATHALQHALNHPKATSLNGLVDALVSPEDGRWAAVKLMEWGEGAAIALSRYTEGSLRGLFDGQDASLPETDLPILSFDFSAPDRNSPAIPSLMAAVSCWAEHVWLRQSTAVHRHLVLEEAWQILLSPATAELIQRLLKNSRKAALSLDVVMHTLSDLGDGKAQDLARLCEIAHVGRLNPEEAAIVGGLLGLPHWAVERIPSLGPGQAVWKIGPDYVDIVETVLDAAEIQLTDTSARRRQAQQPASPEETTVDAEQEPAAAEEETAFGPSSEEYDSLRDLKTPAEQEPMSEAWDDWDMPPNVIDTRHQEVIQAAREGRSNEAAQLAAIGEREDIRAHGIASDEAASWLATRAHVADLSGNRDQATQLRATVARMGKAEWFENASDSAEPAWYSAPRAAVAPAGSPGPDHHAPSPPRRRTWSYVAAIATLGIVAACVWQSAADDNHRQDRKAKAAAYKGRSGASVELDGVDTDLVAQWSTDGTHVVVELRSYADRNAKFLRIDAASGQTAQSTRGSDRWFPKTPEISLPVTDALADVTVRIAVGGKRWKQGMAPYSRTVRLSPTGIAYDAQTGDRLPED